MSGSPGPWTTEAVQALTALWSHGDTSSEIARALCLQFGPHFTRNSIIGKRLRLGLPGRSTQGSQPRKPRARRPREKRISIRPKAIKPQFESEPYEATPIEVLSPHPKVLLDLMEGDCKWPLGEGPYTFCANEKLEGCSYCKGHARIAYAGAKRGWERPEQTFAIRRRDHAAVQVIARSMDGEEAA